MTLPFAILAVVTLAGAIAAMSLRNLVHCALCLAVTFAGIAALYLQLGIYESQTAVVERTGTHR